MKLNADIRYKKNRGKLPICVFMHGFSTDSDTFNENTKKRFSENGVFAIFPNMRGRLSSEGSPDCSGREIHDIIDIVEYVKSNYSSYVDPSQIHIVGYSGGGGNALNCAVKFPDYFNSVTNYFGISDYGYDTSDGWYANGADGIEGRQTMLQTWIGGTPTNVPDAYMARCSVLAINNFKGRLNVFHDIADTLVPVINSENILEKNPDNLFFSKSLTTETRRWMHGIPNSDYAVHLMYSESEIFNAIKKRGHPELVISETGTLTVLGYCKTKRFSIWLGGLTEAAAGAGLNEVATVAYNTITGTYTVTPLTGAMDVFIKQGSLMIAQNITEETILTVA